MAKDNVEIIDGFYFGGTDDFLMPKKPNIDWGEEPQTPTASFVGGLGLDSSEKANSQDPLQIDTTPARKRRSGLSHTMLGIADLFNISSGDPDAYLGQSLDRAQHIDETRMKEYPEGYQIDMNRAKLLSQKAQAEEDPTRKAIYGREIKKLLPNETQGLDDLTAADFLVGDDKFRQKMQLEQLKGLNQLNLQKLKNGGNLDVAKLKATSNEDIAAMKVNAITNRGTRKDFVDMARLLDDYSLSDIFSWYREKYSTANPALAMRSMSYFVDAETMPMPRMLIPFDWEGAKDRIRAAVRKLVMSAGGHRV